MLKKFLCIGILVMTLSACGGGAAQETATQPAAVPPAVPPAAGEVTSVPAPEPTAPAGEPASLTVMTHDSFAASEEVIRAFETENNVRLSFVQSGDAGSALNRAVLSKDAPIADVFFGVDNTFLSRALEAGIFEPYRSPLLESVPTEFQIDSQNRVTPIDYGDVCINYDRAYFEEEGLAVPQTLEDLVKPEYSGLLVVENPATSSPGLAFLLATIAEYGQDDYLDYWSRLVDNDVVVVNDWETAYYTNFSASSGQGPQPLVVSYGSSPAAEVFFADTPPAQAPTGSIVGPNTCFRQIEFAGILTGTRSRPLAEKLIDFLLSQSFQEDMPLQMFVFPVSTQAKLPEVFQQYAEIPEQPASLPYEEIAASREAWIQAWMDVVLR